MGISVNQLNVLFWVIVALLILTAVAFVTTQVGGLDILFDFSTNGHCVGTVCPW